MLRAHKDEIGRINMDELLFNSMIENSYEVSILKNFFNSIYDNYFTESLQHILANVSFGDEYRFCTFQSDLEPLEDIAFTGVKVRICDTEIIVSAEQFKEIFLQACERYSELHTGALDVFKGDIQNWSLKDVSSEPM